LQLFIVRRAQQYHFVSSPGAPGLASRPDTISKSTLNFNKLFRNVDQDADFVHEKNARKASGERKLKIAEAVVVAGAKLSAF
jgi:hypothetical protein